MGEPRMPRMGRRQFLWLAVAASVAGCANPITNTAALGQSGRLSLGGSVKPRLSPLPAFGEGNTDSAIEDNSLITAEASIDPKDDLRRVATDNNRFAFEWFAALRAANPTTNLVASPLSLYTAFAMLYAGAGGDTASQMADTLHYGLTPAQLHVAIGALMSSLTGQESADAFTLSIANGVWAQQGHTYEPSYTETLTNYYGAALQLTDFAHNAGASVGAINQWMDTATHGKIPHVLSQLDPATTLVLVNAIYFNGTWATPFKPSDTYNAPFTALDDSVVEIPTMHLTARLAYTEAEGYQAVALPYQRERARLIVVLPASTSLATIEQSFTAEGFASLARTLDTSRTVQVALALPKFEDTATTVLQPSLAALGLTLPFGNEADFSGINCQIPLKVDQALHQASITVDEQGTEAAAVTAIAVTTLSAVLPQPAIEMNVNRPFLYFLQDKATGAILFAGRRVTG